MKHTIFVICPSIRDRVELSKLSTKDNYHILFHDYKVDSFERILANGVVDDFVATNPSQIIDSLLLLARSNNVNGIVSTDDYPGSIYASIVGHYCNLVGARPAALLQCQHKYNARLIQEKYVPHATPKFTLFNDLDSIQAADGARFSYPVFVKPVKSYYSVGANKATNYQQLQEMLRQALLPSHFLSHFNWFLKTFGGSEIDSCAVMVEEYLSGVQVTLEGYCYQGQIEIVGIVDSIMFPGTISFARFEYPSSLPQAVQNRMGEIALTIVKAMHLDNCMFNIEFMYNPETDKIGIIEINPRMAAQFADLYEKVDGFNTYQLMLDIALGKKPVIFRKKGNHAIAASCVLRTFENKKVLQVPTQDQIAHFFRQFPDARFYADVKPGMLLSDVLQDGKSYRYGLIHLGAQDKQDLLNRFEKAKKLLPFDLVSSTH
ncbi:MAG: ATP-grasp domain-containing protein [Candidatus Dependentiae bacterium]